MFFFFRLFWAASNTSLNRLLKLCQKELEADLSASKSDFLRAVADLSSVKEEKTRLEARVCILESRDKDEEKEQKRGGGKEKEELNVAEAPRQVVAPAKFTAPEPLKPSSKRNLRRSSRLHNTCNKLCSIVVQLYRSENIP